ncbi:MAG TPA: hypothetical protein VGC41_20475, partial [Kofleriaceae bacterium]
MGKIFVAMLAMSLVACAHHGSDDDDDDGTMYTSVRLSPDPVTLTVALGGTATQDYVVLGTDSTGEHEITDKCALSIDATFGTTAGKTVTVSSRGGTTSVTAICGASQGAATLNVNLTGSMVSGNAPPNSDQIFGTATVDTTMPANNPTVEYPIDKAVAPLNIPSIAFQWTKPSGDLFHLHLASTHASIDAYTTDPQNTFSEADWISIANTAVGESLNVTVEALTQANPAMKYTSTAVTLNLSHDTIDTSAIYWWASSAQKIMTQQFGQTGAPQEVVGDCSGCHSLSRSGSRIGYCRCVGGNCGQEWVGFLKYDDQAMQWKEQINANAMTIHGTYTSFAPLGNPFPDDTKAIAAVTAIDGTANLYDPDTGVIVPSNINAQAKKVTGTNSFLMPDWSPDGNNIVFAAAGQGANVDVSSSSLAIMSYVYDNAAGTHTFGDAKYLLQQPITVNGKVYNNLFFPSYSPDNQWIVFNAARSGWRNTAAHQGATPGQRLMLMPAGGGAPMDLTALNGGDVDADITWPHWAPGATSDYYWVVFSSERNYGHLLTQANTAAACIQNGMNQC